MNHVRVLSKAALKHALESCPSVLKGLPIQSVLQSETDDQLTTISCAISSANFKLQVVLNKIFQKIVFSKSTSILPINYI